MNIWLKFNAYHSPEYRKPEDTESVIIPLDRIIKIECDEKTWIIYLDVKSDPNLISRIWLPATEEENILEQLKYHGIRFGPTPSEIREYNRPFDPAIDSMVGG